ncbi:hypothetical protein B0H10DRAFT_2114952 [Mycena sp. CBHHK59/15]|nr:hypothetical protein B0H10DRAFT_2114952 [Mycena sp. CBHHK59/15]
MIRERLAAENNGVRSAMRKIVCVLLLFVCRTFAKDPDDSTEEYHGVLSSHGMYGAAGRRTSLMKTTASITVAPRKATLGRRRRSMPRSWW